MNYSIALRTLVTKEVFRFIRIWPQTLLPPAITTALYFLIFGKLIGERIGTINGATYMDYIVPGIILDVGHQSFLLKCCIVFFFD